MMYRQAYQRGMLTIFFSVGSKPLAIWDTFTQDGYITRFLDDDIKSMVLEIGGTNVSTTYMICPKGNTVLGITMPFLVMIVKNLRKYFSFEVTILDETGTRRRFRVSNFQSTTQILPLCTVMPIGLTEGWNQIQFNLAEFTRRAYKKQFVEVQKLKINANIRLRRIYFAERIVPEDQLPAEYKLFFPLKQKPVKDKKTITNTTQEQIESPEKITELVTKDDKEDLSQKPVVSSIQVIKTESNTRQSGQRSSHLLKVTEDELDRINAATSVLSVPLITVEPDATSAADSKPTEPIIEEVPAQVAEEAPAGFTEEAPPAVTEEAPAGVTEKSPAGVTEQAEKNIENKTTDIEGGVTTEDEVAAGYEEDEEDGGGASLEPIQEVE